MSNDTTPPAQLLGRPSALAARPAARARARVLERRAAPAWARVARPTLLMLFDALTIAAISLVAVRLWAIGVRGQQLSIYLALWPLLPIFLLGYAKAGLYPGHGLGAVEILRRFTLRTSFIFIALAAASFVFKLAPQYSRATFFLAWVGVVIVLPAAHLLFLALMKRLSWWCEPAVVVGDGELGRRTVVALKGALTQGFEPRWVITPEPHGGSEIEGCPVIGGLEWVENLARRGVRVALVADEGLHQGSELMDQLHRHFRRVILVRGNEGEPIHGVEVRNMGGVLGIEFENQLLVARNRWIKRAVDLVAGSLLLVAVSPLIALAVAVIKLVSPGPAFYSQQREGLNGRSIPIWKLRTMYTDAEQRLERHLSADEQAREEWLTRYKLTHDPRILPVVGRLLRRFSIDELPQLWQVVKGEMSLVGPRPFPHYHLERFPERFLELRRRVRPGLTGLWQIMVRSTGGIDDQQQYDSYYIRNWSPWLDAYILSRTAVTVIVGKGAS